MLLLLQVLLARLILLLLVLLLELRRNGRDRRRSGLEALLRLALAGEPGILLLQRLGWRLRGAGRLGLHGVAGVLLLKRLLAVPGGLRRKGARLLAGLLLASSHSVEGAAILLLLLASWALAVGAHVGVRIGVHGDGCRGARVRLGCSGGSLIRCGRRSVDAPQSWETRLITRNGWDAWKTKTMVWWVERSPPTAAVLLGEELSGEVEKREMTKLSPAFRLANRRAGAALQVTGLQITRTVGSVCPHLPNWPAGLVEPPWSEPPCLKESTTVPPHTCGAVCPDAPASHSHTSIGIRTLRLTRTHTSSGHSFVWIDFLPFQ